MKRTRKILTVLLVLNFFIGIEAGMKEANLLLVIGNAALVVVTAVKEIKDGRNDEES